MGTIMKAIGKHVQRAMEAEEIILHAAREDMGSFKNGGVI